MGSSVRRKTRTPADRPLLAAWLRAIPQSRHQPRPLAELPGGDVIGSGLATMLQTWGAVELSDEGIRAVSQPAYYFLHSLAAWAEFDGPVIQDWTAEQGTTPGEGLRHGTTLVHLLESERFVRDPQAFPIRQTLVAQVLIVQSDQPPRFLAQWDERAGQFQLIGGRQKQDQDWAEPILTTAVREVEEELNGQVSYAAGDFEVAPLTSFEGETRLSPSFGALTSYGFTFFHARNLKSIQPGAMDRWVTRTGLLEGATADGLPVRGDHVPLLERALGYTIDELPSSFRSPEP